MQNSFPFIKYMDMSARTPLLNRIVANRLDRAIYKRVVGADCGRHLRPVTEKRYLFLASLAAMVMKNIRRGYISSRAVEGLANVFLNDALLENNTAKQAAREKFAEKHGRGAPNFIVLSPTQACNLHCEGCYAGSDSADAPTLDFDTVDRIVGETRNIFGNSFIVLSGGEPLMYRSGGKTIFDLFRRYPDMFFMFYTNGTLITPTVAAQLAEVGNASPAISVEGYESLTDRRRGNGVYMRILCAMNNLRNAGVPFGVSITATSRNVHILKTDEFYDHFFEHEGASYAWQFQFMPIGRGKQAFDLMVSPEERIELYRTWERQLSKRHAIADFWNSGVLTNGCIAYGGNRGYIHIDWNGNIMPCVFVPYYTDNIRRLYAEGKTLADALDSEMMRRGRRWQDEYLTDNPQRPKNMIMPCSIRDHFAAFRENIVTSDAAGENAEATEILADKEYFERMTDYDRRLHALSQPIWEREYLSHGTRAE